jgi:hypothetical protein
MAIIFNIYAVIQAFIIGLVLGAVYLLMKLFHIEDFGGTQGSAITFQVMALLAAYTDAKGIKGRIFFLPTWIILIGTSYVMLEGAYDTNSYHELMLAITSLMIVLLYIKWQTTQLKKTWIKKQIALEMLESKIRTNTCTDKEYWTLASHVYYDPSTFFLFLYPIWKIVFRNAIEWNSFQDHNKRFLNSIKLETVPKERLRGWVREFRDALNTANSFKNYSHPLFAFRRLATVIDETNRSLR